MLKVRIIPTLLWKDVGLVKGKAFDSWRRVDTVLPVIKVYNMREVDEMILLDISATRNMREPDYESIAEFASECFVPLTVGGGVSNIQHIKQLLRVGADKVAINSAAYRNPKLINEASDMFGTQCVVVSIDVRKNSDGIYQCYSECGNHLEAVSVVDWAKEMASRGAGELLITSIENDGMMKGYDIELISQVTKSVNIPVIASGGAGCYQDFVDAICISNASAVAAASIFHFTEQTPLEAKKYMTEKGIAVRNMNSIMIT